MVSEKTGPVYLSTIFPASVLPLAETVRSGGFSVTTSLPALLSLAGMLRLLTVSWV